ncbi:hypothetical protein QBC36DRAFT_368177 [Triangularia setosa]|uniref:Fucose-specific lectin n=1 Tax=Triangularia setosa TaxID=2587417 RepID=A0AAN7A207_9PEZI|nr:hypothetical protein QBC36DRAFT_368177 [Podospora setosa]
MDDSVSNDHEISHLEPDNPTVNTQQVHRTMNLGRLLRSLTALSALPFVLAQGTGLEAAGPLSRLASWSKVNLNGPTGPSADCLLETQPGYLYTHIYYQSPDQHLREAYLSPGQKNWTQGKLSSDRPVSAVNNTPLAVVHWTDTSDVITLWYAAPTTQELTEKRFLNGAWQPERGLNAKVHVSPARPGSIAAVAESPAGWVSVMYRDDINRVRICRYHWNSTSVNCAGAYTFTGALDGTSTSGFFDADGSHFFYQSRDSPYDAVELVPSGTGSWKSVTAFPTKAQGVQFAASRNRWPGTAVERHMLVSTTDNVLSEVYSSSYCGGWCNCYAGISSAKPGPLLGLAVSSCTVNAKAYWVTPDKQIAEMTVDATKGWVTTNTNILA